MDLATTLTPTSRGTDVSLTELDVRSNTWRLVYAEYLAGLTPQTRRVYQPKIDYFFGWASRLDGLTPVRTPADVTRPHGVAFRQHLENRIGRGGKPMAASTVALYLTAVSAFLDHCTVPFDTSGTALLLANPISKVPRPKVEPYSSVRKLAWGDYCRLWETIAKDKSEAGLRDFALLVVYTMTGRRREEIASLRGQDFEETHDGQILYHYTGKGGKSRKRLLPPPARRAIDDYLSATGRAELSGLADDDPVFLSTRGPKAGKALASDGILRMLKSRARKAGIDPKRVLAHGLRHTYAETRWRARMDLQALSKSLDHSSIATTGRYMAAHNGEEDNHWQAQWNLLPGAFDQSE